jgi:hypothetical protein
MVTEADVLRNSSTMGDLSSASARSSTNIEDVSKEFDGRPIEPEWRTATVIGASPMRQRFSNRGGNTEL